MFEADGADGVVVDAFVVWVFAVVVEGVVNGFVEGSGEVDFHAMGEVSAVFEDEGCEGVAGLHEGHECGGVCLCTGVWLDVCVGAVEELFGAFACEVFDAVVVFAPAVVSAAWVALGVFVGEACSHGVHDSGGDMVLAGDEFDG